MTESLENNNKFTIKYYKEFLTLAKDQGYFFVTLRDFLKKGCPSEGHVVLRHDLDLKPQTMQKMLDVENELGINSSIFVRITGNAYNFLSYPVLHMIRKAELDGHEIGLHTSCVEFGQINNVDPLKILSLECDLLSKFVNLEGIAPHRDLNYAYNSLPYIEKNWPEIEKLGVSYHAYQKQIEEACVYVNEGFNPHLCWRKYAPEDIIPTGKSMCILTHNHWWYDVHPFEEWR